MRIPLKEIAALVGGHVRGDGAIAITGVAGLEEAKEGDLSFLSNKRYLQFLSKTRASAVLVDPTVPEAPVATVVVKNPSLALTQLMRHVTGPGTAIPPGAHPSAVIGKDVRLGKDVSVGAATVIEDGASIGDGTILYPLVYIGHGATVGAQCKLYPHATVYEKCILGNRVILHSGAVVGSDGFGYLTLDGVHHKIPQLGIAVLEDDVEIGANTAIDRARFDRTVVKKGAKIDNLVQIAHNVVVGEGSLLAAQAGVAGSTVLGRYVMLGGQAGVVGHLELADGTKVTAQSGLTKDTQPGRMYSGEYAVEYPVHMRQLAALRKLPGLLKEVKELKEELEAMRRKTVRKKTN